MSRRHSRVGSSRRRNGVPTGTLPLSRVRLFGILPIVLGVGFFASRAIAVAIFGASAVAFLWGLVIGLSFAVGGTTVLCVTDHAEERFAPGIVSRHESARTTLAALGGALFVGLVAAALL